VDPPKKPAGTQKVHPLIFQLHVGYTKKIALFRPSRRFKKASLPNGQKNAQRARYTLKIIFFKTEKNGCMDVCVGKLTDFKQDWFMSF
jgi:hypothetical protein